MIQREYLTIAVIVKDLSAKIAVNRTSVQSVTLDFVRELVVVSKSPGAEGV
jgi:hypothetical protein